ncbi:MAG: desulfoferrodoxin [Planctomycetes bacterium]|nr:desulfoferrodoxin [Planctomycetota bacterium]
MTEKLQVYKCEHCGNIVEVFVGGGAPLSCCGTKMVLLEAKTADATTEKHVPVIEKIEGGYKVTVGSTLHPMTDEHYIQWIELIRGDVVTQAYLSPGEAPEAVFFTGNCECPVTAREHCNMHGLWKG